MTHADRRRLQSGCSALAAAAALCLAAPTAALATPLALAAIEDSIVLQDSAANNPFPGLLASELGTSGAGSIWLSVLKFDLSGLAGLQVNSASLQLSAIFNHSSDAFVHQVYSSSDDSWGEATVNGINRPADSTLTLLDAASIDGQSRVYSWNVLAGMQGAAGLAGPNTLLTLLIRPDLAQAGNAFGPHFNDRSVADGAPRLLLDVSPVPEPAHGLLLAAGLLALWRWLARAAGAGRRLPPVR